MKKANNKLTFKNSILIFVSALALIAASLCWFSIASNNDVNSFNTGVGRLSSNMAFYQAVDANRDGVISGGETYVQIQGNDINTRYMVPGETYFYKVTIVNYQAGSHFALIFNDISDADSMSSHVNVTARVVNSSNTTVASTDAERTIAYYSQTANNQTDATILTGSNLASGVFDIYYTVKLDGATTNDFENKSMTINDVLVSFFSS